MAEMDIVTSALVLLWEIRCVFFPLSRLVCVLSQKEVFIYVSSYFQAFPVEAPYLLHALPYLAD